MPYDHQIRLRQKNCKMHHRYHSVTRNLVDSDVQLHNIIYTFALLICLIQQIFTIIIHGTIAARHNISNDDMFPILAYRKAYYMNSIWSTWTTIHEVPPVLILITVFLDFSDCISAAHCLGQIGCAVSIAAVDGRNIGFNHIQVNTMTSGVMLDTLGLEQNWRYSAHDIFKGIFFKETFCIYLQMLRTVPLNGAVCINQD